MFPTSCSLQQSALVPVMAAARSNTSARRGRAEADRAANTSCQSSACDLSCDSSASERAEWSLTGQPAGGGAAPLRPQGQIQ